MKILFVNNYWYMRGGAERVAFLEADMLREAGHEVAFFGMHDSRNVVDQTGFADGVHHAGLCRIRSAIRAIYNRNAVKAFRAALFRFRPDVVHCHNIYHHLSFAILGEARRAGVPVVLTLHDYKILSPNYRLFHNGKICTRGMDGRILQTVFHNCMGSFLQSIGGAVEAFLRARHRYLCAVAAYIAPSAFLHDLCVAHGVPRAQLHHIENPYDGTDMFLQKNNGRAVVFVGRLSEEKGILLLLSAMKDLKDIPCLIAGDGPLKKQLVRIIKKEGLKNVQLLGRVEGEALLSVYASAKLLVLPSIWYENAPMSVLDGLSAGVISIGSDIGGIPEMLSSDQLFASGNSNALAEKIRFFIGMPKDDYNRVLLREQQKIIGIHNIPKHLSSLLSIYGKVQAGFAPCDEKI